MWTWKWCNVASRNQCTLCNYDMKTADVQTMLIHESQEKQENIFLLKELNVLQDSAGKCFAKPKGPSLVRV